MWLGKGVFVRYEACICLVRTSPFPAPESVIFLPPLDCLRFFEADARHRSFAHAGKELGVIPPAVAHRIRMLEGHLRAELFERRRRGVRLNHRGRAYYEEVRRNRRGRACLKEVQRILAEVHGASERQRTTPRRVRIVSVEAVAEKWLLPRLASFKASHPGIAIELETNHRGVDPAQRDFDAWLACSGETSAPRPLTRCEDALLEETLYEEALLPVPAHPFSSSPRTAPSTGNPCSIRATTPRADGRRARHTPRTTAPPGCGISRAGSRARATATSGASSGCWPMRFRASPISRDEPAPSSAHDARGFDWGYQAILHVTPSTCCHLPPNTTGGRESASRTYGSNADGDATANVVSSCVLDGSEHRLSVCGSHESYNAALLPALPFEFESILERNVI